ncbi:MAG: hypothetical protein D6160_08685 [Ketobacter sp.]|nr:MAG: hypothetical protein D6160_08685 [Ketobacter sp.]
MRSISIMLGGITLLLPQLSFAHLVTTRLGEFYSGLAHPITSLEHLLPWLALGLLAGIQQRNTSRSVLLWFPFTVATGAILGGWLPGPTWIQTLNLFFLCNLGLLVLLALRLKQAVFVLLAVVFGFTQGFANGVNTLQGSDLLLYVCGVTSAAYILMALVTAVAFCTYRRSAWGPIALRAVGSWMLAIGMMYGGFLLFAPGHALTGSN